SSHLISPKYRHDLSFATKHICSDNTSRPCRMEGKTNEDYFHMATTFGERLKLAMRKAKITQAEMAEKLGITQQSVQFACSPKSKSSKHTERMAEILGVSASWLAFGTDSPEPQAGPIGKAVPLYSIDQLSKGEETEARTPCPFHCGPNT